MLEVLHIQQVYQLRCFVGFIDVDLYSSFANHRVLRDAEKNCNKADALTEVNDFNVS